MLVHTDANVSTKAFENRCKDLEWESASNYRRVALRRRVQSNLCCLTAQQLHLVLYGGFLQHVASFLDVLWYAV